MLHYLKYKNQQVIGEFLGDWYGSSMASDPGLKKIDYVVPVPLHPQKLKKRGYNQVDLFGMRIAEHLQATFSKEFLKKVANTKTQTKKGRFFRWQNSHNLYETVNSDSLQNKNVLLIDDVITTGATIEACATALKSAFEANIYVATMAVVPKLGI
ncbi:MAG: ComF family protein [Bacteroidota bacterium]